MPRFVTHLASPASSGPIELFPDPESVFEHWSDELAARLLPIARFDLALLEGRGLAGTGVVLYYEDVRCSFLDWTMRDGKVVRVHEAWRSLRAFAHRPSREHLAEAAGGTHATLERYEVELPAISEIGRLEWATRFERALRSAGARTPGMRLRLDAPPCFVQDGYVDDGDFVLCELPASALELAPMYFYVFGDGTELAQMMQMT